MTDTGQNITAPADEMTLADLQSKQDDSQGRFEFIPDTFPGYAWCSWVNYEKKSGKRVKDQKTGAWKLLDRQTKRVKVV